MTTLGQNWRYKIRGANDRFLIHKRTFCATASNDGTWPIPDARQKLLPRSQTHGVPHPPSPVAVLRYWVRFSVRQQPPQSKVISESMRPADLIVADHPQKKFDDDSGLRDTPKTGPRNRVDCLNNESRTRNDAQIPHSRDSFGRTINHKRPKLQ